MPRFEASLTVADVATGLRAVVDVDADRLVLRSAAGELGSWSLADLVISREDDGFHLLVDDEELVLVVSDPDGFASLVATPTPTRGGTAPQPVPAPEPAPSPSPPEAPPADAGRASRQLPGWAGAAAAALVGCALLIVFAPGELALLLLIPGAVLLLAGAMAAADPYLALKIPGEITATWLILLGLGLLLAAVTVVAFT